MNQPTNQPNEIWVTISKTGITVDNRSDDAGDDPNNPNNQKVWGKRGKTVTFHIENTTCVDQTVRIPPVEIVRSDSPEYRLTAPQVDHRPSAPLKSGKHTVVVAPDSSKDITVTVKDKYYFPWDKEPWT